MDSPVFAFAHMTVNLNLSICLLHDTSVSARTQCKASFFVWFGCVSINPFQLNTELFSWIEVSSAWKFIDSPFDYFLLFRQQENICFRVIFFPKHSTLIIGTKQLQIYDMTLSVDEMHYIQICRQSYFHFRRWGESHLSMFVIMYVEL